MARAVVTVGSGGMPVVDVTATKPLLGLPVTEGGAGGYGRRVTKVTNGLGIPVTYVAHDGVLPAERLTNGNFALNPINASQLTIQNGWQWNRAATAVVSWAAGVVNLNPDGTRSNLFSAPVPGLVVGRSYRLEADLGANTIIQTGTGISGDPTIGLSGQVINAVYSLGRASVVFVATATTMYVGFGRFSAASTATIDNVSLYGPL